MKKRCDAPVIAIYTNIGRGHPNYLDSVRRYLKDSHPEQYQQIQVTSIFEISRGLSLLGWKIVRRMYRTGSRGGLISNLYRRFRSGQSEYDRGSILIRLLRRDLRAHLKEYDGICLVAHPLLANMLKDEHRVFYLHGEIAAPTESGVLGIERIYVPLPETREKMCAMGISAGSLMETGLVLEPELCENICEVVQKRIARVESTQPLTVGFFISGAYPKRHVDLIVEGVKSCYSVGFNVRLFWGCDSKEVRRLVNALREFSGEIVNDDPDSSAISDSRMVIVTADSREAETLRSIEYLPGLDVFCAAPHERVNWAVGAGLPLIIIRPAIGTFAPENRAFVLKSGCGLELSDNGLFSDLGRELTRIRQSGQLLEMIEAGQRIRLIHGAKVIAEDLIDQMAQP